ncbi:AMP-binding protein [Herbivorax sp. ANBcel31]|uniref:AMP-binding protein n=1 Tax=Herbivorax sp. ANBcel31 TaxID=3069754 RepID=UPI0027B3C2AA|nr:AMP-binding protein [Herbivorax sp. ANBcel31]MDQ2086408.1 AMP-binding protein [Herbivorax sp. ANBcel31]
MIYISYGPFSFDKQILSIIVGVLLTGICKAIPVMLFSPKQFIRKPSQWLHYINDYRATLSAANNFAFNYCVKRIRDTDVQGIDLSSWRICFNGSEHISAKIIEEFNEKFTNIGFDEKAMLPCYGLAEATLAVTISDKDAKPNVFSFDSKAMYEDCLAKECQDKSKNSIKLVSLGNVDSNTEIKIEKSCGEEAEEGKIGEIIIKGKSLFSNYLNSKDECLRDGWFATGDLGFIYKNNLFITGRKKDLIIINGRHYLPSEIEKTVINKEYAGIKACVAFSVYELNNEDEKLALVIETVISKEDLLLDIIKKIKNNIFEEVGVRVKYIFATRKIERTINGKVRRQDCKLKYTNMINKKLKSKQN